jgi:biopolymer transport protein ExbB
MMHLLQQGGVFIMIPLLLASVVAVGISLERVVYFASIEWGGDSFRAKLRQLLSGGQLEQAQQYAVSLKGPVAAHALSALKAWSQSDAIFEGSIAAQSQVEESELNKSLSTLETITTASPLIGLLGTITGMMGVFRAVSEKLAQSPQADTSTILAGIGEALIATATGILVAVFCLVAHNIFQSLAERAMESCQRVINELSLIRLEQLEKKSAKGQA